MARVAAAWFDPDRWGFPHVEPGPVGGRFVVVVIDTVLSQHG